MNRCKHLDAVRRYGVLIGDVEDASEVERAEALFHREEFGDEYVPKDGHAPLKAGLLLRFMHEARCIPLGEAYSTVIGLLQDDATLDAAGRTPEQFAGELAQMTGNILITVALATLYLHAAEGGRFEQFYSMVLEVLTNGQPVKDDGSSEGHTLH